MAKKHSNPKADVTFQCKLCKHSRSLRLTSTYKNQHGFPAKTANNEPDYLLNEIDDANHEEELHS